MVRLTDRPDITLAVYRERKTTKQQQLLINMYDHAACVANLVCIFLMIQNCLCDWRWLPYGPKFLYRDIQNKPACSCFALCASFQVTKLNDALCVNLSYT